MEPDMFAGWGVRTLSEHAGRFNPIGYHTGSIWPFDNSIILAGFRRYGRDALAERIFAGTFAAANYFDYRRLPEFFSGASRLGEGGPARCPRADPLQAWSSGALLFMLINLLGLEPDGFLRRLRIVRPMLPESVDRLELRALRIGGAMVDLIFERRGGKVEVSVGRRDGTLDIEV
jgi:glycogen debranching enzyme